MEKKKALITGITGQDGSYLAELLLQKDYEVYGIIRRSSSPNTHRIDHLIKDYHNPENKIHKIYGNLNDISSILSAISKVKPDEIYNLAAQSHVRISFDVPIETSDVVALGTLRILEVIKSICPKARYYQASSSEMFGKVLETPQTEKTPFNPVSPYALSKVFAFNMTKLYRDSYNLHASNGILFNHESERRGVNFVTKKITVGLARIKHGLQKKLYLGNLDAKRDWGYARDFVEAMWLILQQDKPDDYVIGTGETHSVREFLEEAAKVIGLNIYSNEKKGVEEKYLDENGNTIIEIDPIFFRPLEVDYLLSNPAKARGVLKWEPRTKFKELVRIMANNDLSIAEKEAYLKKR